MSHFDQNNVNQTKEWTQGRKPDSSFWYGEKGIARRGGRKRRAREGLERGVQERG